MAAPSLKGRAIAVAMVGTPLALSIGIPVGIFVGQLIGRRAVFGLMTLLSFEPDELRPEDVAPSDVFLASKACTSGGWVLRAANRRLHAMRAAEVEDVDYPRDIKDVPAHDPEAVAAAWSRIAIARPESRFTGR